MNERIFKLALDAGLLNYVDNETPRRYFIDGHADLEEVKKFAELIVRDCINTIENRAPGQMGKEGEGWTNGYNDGLKTGAFLIKQHFGVQE